mmetsp:Transcript_14947/g.34975  ORF Transcript_14947/g.34975 Transcript_14947/m.34975 type:complete len:212 (-) Transcript_14947:63-698(-)
MEPLRAAAAVLAKPQHPCAPGNQRIRSRDAGSWYLPDHEREQGSGSWRLGRLPGWRQPSDLVPAALPLWNFGLAFCNPAPGGTFFFTRALRKERPRTEYSGMWRCTGKQCIFWAAANEERDEFCVQGNIPLAEPCCRRTCCSDVNLANITRIVYRCLALMHPFGLQFLSPDVFSYRTVLFWALMFKAFEYDLRVDLSATLARCQIPYLSVC